MLKYISILYISLSACFLNGRDSITVYIFLLDECKICQDVAPEIGKIAKEYEGEIGFLGLFPNFSSKSKGIASFKAKYNLPFSLKTDYTKTKSTQFNAEILPEIVVFNETTKEILYRGMVNDLYIGPSKKRYRATTHYLKDVLDDIRSGNTIRHAFTLPVGCFINYADNILK